MSRNVARLAMSSCGAAFMTVFCVAAGAQGSPRPEPANPKATVQALDYESPFKGYRKFEEESVASWRGANDLAHKLGGWKAYASDKVPEIAEPPSGRVAPAKPAPQQAPASGGGHAGHKKTP